MAELGERFAIERIADLSDWQFASLVQQRAWFSVIALEHSRTHARATCVVANEAMPPHKQAAMVRAAGCTQDARHPVATCIAQSSTNLPWALYDCDARIDLTSLYDKTRDRLSDPFFDAHDILAFAMIAFESRHVLEQGRLERGFGSIAMANFFCDPMGQVWRFGLFDSFGGPEDEERRLGVVKHHQPSAINIGIDVELVKALLVGLPTSFVAVHPTIQRVLTGNTLPEDAAVDALLSRVALGTWGPSSARFDSMREVINIFSQLGVLLGLDGSPHRFAERLRARLVDVGLGAREPDGQAETTSAVGDETVASSFTKRPDHDKRRRVVLSSGGVFDLDDYFCERHGRRTMLTRLEVRLLDYFMAKPHAVVETAELLAQVWGYAADSPSRAVSDCIKRLRRKLEPDASAPVYITNVFGIGYKFVP